MIFNRLYVFVQDFHSSFELSEEIFMVFNDLENLLAVLLSDLLLSCFVFGKLEVFDEISASAYLVGGGDD